MDKKENKELKALQKELAQQEAALRRMRKQLSLSEAKPAKTSGKATPARKKAPSKKAPPKKAKKA